MNAVSFARRGSIPVDIPSPGIFTFPALSPAFCEALVEEVYAYKEWAKQHRVPLTAPNSMNRYGLALDALGLGTWAEQLADLFVEPIRRNHFPDFAPITPSGVYGFVVEYEQGKQTRLNPHYDAPSALTLNVALTSSYDYEGGELVFYGARCTRHAMERSEISYELEHSIGRGLVHLGRRMHAAKPITSGRRFNLILWCSAKRTSRKHPAWCGGGRA